MQSVMDRDIDHILVSEEQLKTRVAELGTQISKDYAGKNLLLVSILKGSVVFMADLMRAVSIPCGICLPAGRKLSPGCRVRSITFPCILAQSAQQFKSFLKIG